jgi:hypothetical protein
MDIANLLLADFNNYNVNFINVLIDFYNNLDLDDRANIENNLNDLYGNISMKPNQIQDLRLVEINKLRNYYSAAPSINLNKFYAYNFEGHKIYLSTKITGPNYDDTKIPIVLYDDNSEEVYTSICNNSDVKISETAVSDIKNVYTGIMKNDNNEIPVTIEWIDPKFGNIADEMALYNDLIEAGVQMSNIWLDYSFWNGSVIVKKRVYELDIKDYTFINIKKLGIQMLDLLQQIHKVGVLNNFSIENIVKDENNNYYISDYSSITTNKLFYGFQRFYWNDLWSSQVRETDAVTTPWHDFMELAYLLNYMMLYTVMGDQVPDLKLHVREINDVQAKSVYKFANIVKSYCPNAIMDKGDIIYSILKQALD